RDPLPQLIARAAEPLPRVDEAEFAHLFDRFGDARVVVLGAATEGTSEFIRARAAITRWLIEQRGFNVIALEADWADGRLFNAFARGREPPPGAADPGARFPAWRWRNAEIQDVLEGLRDLNAARVQAPKVGVYGLDLYNQAASMRAVIDYLDRLDPAAAETARRRFGGLTPWADEPAAHGRLYATSAYARHEKTVVSTLTEVVGRQADRLAAEGVLNAAQAARLTRGAEAHYRAAYRGGIEGWNHRAAHMLESLEGALVARGPDAKAVVWAHNAQAGDAQATEMGVIRDAQSLGGHCRRVWGREAALIGLGTHAGDVACAPDWDAALEIKRLNAAPGGSFEAAAHAARIPRCLLDLRPGRNDELRAALTEPRLERFVGPVYRPENERWSHFADCRPSQQFDAWVWFDETSAITPLPARALSAGDDGAEPPPWPFGV
ncbi:MAG TPA: erythromycin esterase family protein, partial [Phenylobacterium sp.]